MARGLSSLQVVKDSPFLDLDSPMTPYEWLKALLLLPWVITKLVVSILGLAMVWSWIRVRPLPSPGFCLPALAHLHSTTSNSRQGYGAPSFPLCKPLHYCQKSSCLLAASEEPRHASSVAVAALSYC